MFCRSCLSRCWNKISNWLWPVTAPDDRQEVIRILMFGPSDVGKTTILRNLVMSYGHFDETFQLEGENRFNVAYMTNVIRPLVYQGVLNNLNTLILFMRKNNISFANSENEERANELLELQSEDLHQIKVITADLKMTIRSIWEDDVTQKVYGENRKDFKLSGNLLHFVSKLDEIADPGYVPSEDDLLHTRWPTEGFKRHYFVIDNMKFKITDIGGHRGQLVNYRNYVEDFLREEPEYADYARVIIFVASLAEYNQVHPDYPDSGPDDVNPRNQQRYTTLDETQMIFRLIAGRPELRDTMLILFLNKLDFFERRLQEHRDFKDYFPDCPDPLNAEVAAKSIQQYFERALDHVPPRVRDQTQLFTFRTCATDRRLMPTIMTLVRIQIIYQLYRVMSYQPQEQAE